MRLNVRTRITLALVSVASTVAMLGLSLGLIPNHQTYIRSGRAALCEAIAANGTLQLREIDLRRWQQLLDLAVQRNDDLLSGGVRKHAGELCIEVGEHAQNWPSALGAESTDQFVHVPIFNGLDERRQPKQWGCIELRFRPIIPTNLFVAAATHPWTKYLLFFGVGSFLVFRWYLARVFKQLDPDQAVPKRVRSAYDFLAGGLVALNKDHMIVLANTAFTEITGVSREDLVGRRLENLPWPGHTEGDFPWIKAGKRHEPQLGETMRYANPELGPRTLMINAAPVIGQDGSYLGLLVGFDDVTPMETAKAELEKSKEAAEAASVAKSAFLANMSHEIRTPMNAILGFADIMRRGFDSSDADRQEYLDIIHSSGQHLLGLINDILDLSKVESGRMTMEIVECYPHRIAQEVRSIFLTRAKEKGLDLKVQVEGTIPESIQADPLRLRQVLTNLVGNALKFTEQGGVSIIMHRQYQDDREMLVYEVVDTGIGIPEEKLETIFDPFSQADSSTTRRFGGTGLGLSISRKFTQLMGGKLVAQSLPEQGSVFIATIDPGPLEGIRMLSHDEVMEAIQQPSESQTATVDALRGRVLVVDDGESNRRLVSLVLTRAGVDVDSAENGQQAVEKVLASAYDLVLMDVEMPVMDGFEAMHAIRSAGKSLPIVALTAHVMKENEDRALQAGFSGFLGKPLSIDRLLELATQYLEPGDATDAEVVSRHVTPVAPTSAEATDDARQDIERITCTLPLEDPDFREIADEFQVQVALRLDKMIQLCAAADFGDLAKEAHWLKGAGGTAGFHAFTEPARKLENSAKSCQVEACEERLERIQQMVDHIWLPPQEASDKPAPHLLPT